MVAIKCLLMIVFEEQNAELDESFSETNKAIMVSRKM